jgi:hypothetical protein
MRSHNDIRQQPRHQMLNSTANRTTVNHSWTAIAPTARIKTWKKKIWKSGTENWSSREIQRYWQARKAAPAGRKQRNMQTDDVLP